MANKNSAMSWSLMLMATLLFGIGLGLSLGYAFFSPRTGTSSPQQQAAAPPAETAAPPPASNPAAPPPATSTAPAPKTAAVPASLPPASAGYWAARHLFIAVNGQWLADATKDVLKEVRPGGVLLQDVNLASRTQTFALVKEIKTATGLGEGLGDLPLIAVSQEGGPFNLLGIDNAPSAQSLGQNGDPDLARKIGQQYGEACVGRGIAIAFAPVLDVYEPGAINPSFAVRSFGTDHTLVARIGLAMADGLREGGVLPVVKHFPGYGAATYGSDGLLVALNKDASGLGRLLYPFDQAVRRGVPGMMVAHVAVPALDPESPRRPAALSPVLVTELLRVRWGYDGVIVADDVALNSMTRSLGAEQAAVQALVAGCDAVLMLDPDPARIRAVVAAIAKAVEDGTLSRDKLQQSVARLQRWQEAIGNLNPIKPNAELDRVAEAVPAPTVETTLPITPPVQAPVTETAPPPAAITEPAPTPAATTPAAPAATEPAPAAATESKPVPAGEEGKSQIEHTVREGEDLNAIAKEYDVSVDDLVRWNALPSTTVASGAKLTVFIESEPKNDQAALAARIAAAAKAVEAKATPKEESPAPESLNALGGKLIHTVAAGDTLASVAEKYHVTTNDIRRWNGLESDTLDAGRILTIFLQGAPADDASADAAKETPPAVTEPAPAPAAETASAPASEPAPAADTTTASSTPETTAPAAPEVKETPLPPPPDIPTQSYVVQVGDTISKIARQFNTTREMVLRLNGLKDANSIKSGQKLKVPQTEPAPATP